jgi:ATP-dependent RNA helicase DDX5/DBP2
MAAATVSAGPRYAAEDPTLPKPWKGLVDPKTGYLYFWNPETNVTQYQRPVSDAQTSPAPLDMPTSEPKTSSPQVDQPSQEQHHNETSAPDDDGCGKGSEVASKATDYESAKPRSCEVQDIPKVAFSAEQGLSAEAYCKKHEISVVGGNVPPPFTSFNDVGLPQEILRVIRSAGFSAPSPIQAQSWPIALQNRDIVAVAKTGSGKTLGYLIPSFFHLKRANKNPKMGPCVLVLSPTRELATQIQDEAVKFGKSVNISCTCLYGGAPKGPQLRELDSGTDIVVATPGRLNDILEMKRVSLGQVSFLVLDEADRMLDMGFEPQIRKIVKEISARRQTLMYTATWPKEVRKIAADLLNKPVQVNIGNVDELVANKSITQNVEVVQYNEKQRRVEQIVRSQEPGSKIIIFCSTKKMCDMLSRNLNRQFGAAAIHGDKSQGERDQVLNDFRTGKCPVLVATDVAARGLDVKDIRVVVNYDFPTGIEDYVHRIGRTGRAGATGIAYTFLGDQDGRQASNLIKILEGANQRVPPEIRELASKGGGFAPRSKWGSSGGGDGGGRGGYGGGFNRDSGGGFNSNTSFQSGGERSRSRSPPKSWGGGNGQSGSGAAASASAGGAGLSFHELMMQKARS